MVDVVDISSQDSESDIFEETVASHESDHWVHHKDLMSILVVS